MTITVSDTSVPVFGSTPYTFDVADGSGTGTAVGTISASDNVSGTLTYALTGDGHDKFAIAATWVRLQSLRV